MAHSGRARHHDRSQHRREVIEEPPVPGRVFLITDAQRRVLAKDLRQIDDARRALEDQQRAENREILRALSASADGMFDLISGLEETEPATPPSPSDSRS